jgi:DNA-binding NarL/FixJ family response regulator
LEDYHIVKQGLRSLVSANSNFEIIGEQSSPRVFLGLLSKIDCHVLILDLSLPEMSGLEVLEKVRTQRPDIHVIIFTMHDNPEYMIRALKLDAGAFLTKDTVAYILIHAISEVVSKGVHYPEQIDLKTASAFTPPVNLD